MGNQFLVLATHNPTSLAAPGEAVHVGIKVKTMQIVLDVMARSSLRESLRELIIADLRRWEYYLEVISEKKIGRRSGWAKIKAKDLNGVLNISWHANSKTLIVRAVGKQGHNPADLVGRFVAYLLDHRRKDLGGVIIRTM